MVADDGAEREGAAAGVLSSGCLIFFFFLKKRQSFAIRLGGEVHIYSLTGGVA